MEVMGATEVSADPVGDLLGAKHRAGSTLKTPDGQKAGHDPHALLILLEAAIVGADTAACPLAHMPGHGISDQPPPVPVRGLQPGAVPDPDQHLAGTAMDLPGTVVIFIAIIALLGFWPQEDERASDLVTGMARPSPNASSEQQTANSTRSLRGAKGHESEHPSCSLPAR